MHRDLSVCHQACVNLRVRKDQVLIYVSSTQGLLLKLPQLCLLTCGAELTQPITQINWGGSLQGKQGWTRTWGQVLTWGFCGQSLGQSFCC